MASLPIWLQAGVWGLVAGSALVIGAAIGAGAILAMLVDTMIPEAFEVAQHYAGLIAVVGFLAAYYLSKLNG
jgi:ZIP family zinc transporter